GRRDDGREWDARAREDDRVDDEDVGHDQEVGQSAAYFGADRGAALGHLEVAVEHVALRWDSCATCCHWTPPLSSATPATERGRQTKSPPVTSARCYRVRSAVPTREARSAVTVAEGVGFGPTEALRLQRFSRPPHSTALPPLRSSDYGLVSRS